MWGGTVNCSIFNHVDKYSLYKGIENEHSSSCQYSKSYWQNEDMADIRSPVYVESG